MRQLCDVFNFRQDGGFQVQAIAGTYKYYGLLLDKSPAHFYEGEREEDQAEDNKVHNAPQQMSSNRPEAERAHQRDQMGEREDKGHGLRPRGQIFSREKCAAEEKHGCDKKKYRQVKHINGRCDAGEIHADGAKGDAAEKGKR